WFYSVSLYTRDTLLPAYTWIMENTPEDLKGTGFTDEEIKQPISWPTYIEKLSGKKFTKAFDRIIEVDLISGGKEYDYLKHSFLDFRLKLKRHNFYNDHINIHCRKYKRSSTKIRKITIELNKSFDERVLTLNNHLVLHVKGRTASFNFN